MMASEKQQETMAKIVGDKYCSILNEVSENIEWRHGGPPIFDAVNKLFEEGRANVGTGVILRVLTKDMPPRGKWFEFYGIGVMKYSISLTFLKQLSLLASSGELLPSRRLEIYYDPAELFAGLLKGPRSSSSSNTKQHNSNDTSTSTHHCPFCK
ncbi:Uncharacterized protein TCM_031874 [Theobroma cacao]|uniref:Uncharacterized protein n=1 Tax=Theobroma cacao TaxID=3641 RepID=A0A061F9E9_THECC|nr:Uncharacterized protein TCM_031874 [Theobroma cacao]